MTNIQSAFGAGIWAIVATLLLLATFEPVEVERKALAASAAVTQTVDA